MRFIAPSIASDVFASQISFCECVSYAFPRNLKIVASFSHHFQSLDALRVNNEKHLQEENHRVDEREHRARYEHVHVLFARIVFVVVVVRAENLPPIIDNYAPSHDVQQRADRREHYQLQSERIDVTWRRIGEPRDPLLVAFFCKGEHVRLEIVVSKRSKRKIRN